MCTCTVEISWQQAPTMRERGGRREREEGGGREEGRYRDTYFTTIRGKLHPLPVTNLLVCLVGEGVVLVALGEDLEEVGVRAEVQGPLVLVVMDIEVSSIGGEEDGNRGAAFLLL